MDQENSLAQLGVETGALRRRTLPPRVVSAGGDLQQATHPRHRIARLIHLDELEDPGGIEPVSRANQAAAFARTSRSSRSCLFSRRRRTSSSRSAVVNPSCRRPSSRSACLTQLWIVYAVGSDSRASSSALRTLLTSSMSCCGYSGGYLGRVRGIVNSFLISLRVSTLPGQLLSIFPVEVFLRHSQVDNAFNKPNNSGDVSPKEY